MIRPVTSFVGDWLDAGHDPVWRENPAQITETASGYVEADREHVTAAIKLLVHKGSRWRETSTVRARAAMLRRVAEVVAERADSLAQAMVREEGKTYREAHGEALRAAGVFEYFAGLESTMSRQIYSNAANTSPVERVHTPLGVVAAITPFNFPLLVPSFKLAPALLAGNSVVFKPSPIVSATSRLLTQAMLDAGVPPEALAVIVGGRPDTVRRLIAYPGVAAVSFTGSGAAGAQVLRTTAEAGKRTQLEMGGSNPVLVLDSDNLAACVAAIGDGAFGGSGQRCTSTRRIYVAAELVEQFMAELVAFADAAVVGSGSDPASYLGPLATVVARENVAGFLDIVANSPDLELATQRPTLTQDSSGYFVNPTVVVDRGERSALADRELFAPVVTVTPVDDIVDGVRRCNATPFGLAAAVWTTPTDRLEHFVRNCIAGMININRSTSGIEADKPFAGLRASSYGPPELGPRAVDFYSAEKTVSTHLRGAGTTSP